MHAIDHVSSALPETESPSLKKTSSENDRACIDLTQHSIHEPIMIDLTKPSNVRPKGERNLAAAAANYCNEHISEREATEFFEDTPCQKKIRLDENQLTKLKLQHSENLAIIKPGNCKEMPRVILPCVVQNI